MAHLVLLPGPETMGDYANILMAIGQIFSLIFVVILVAIFIILLLVSLIKIAARNPIPRKVFFKKLTIIFINLTGIIFVVFTFNEVRNLRFLLMTDTAEPIIEALEEYKADHDEYPKSLEQIVPQYLSKIPSTGMCSYRDFGYHRSDDGSYIMLIYTSSGLMSFDEFTYHSNQDYSNYSDSEIERIGDWIYFHD